MKYPPNKFVLIAAVVKVPLTYGRWSNNDILVERFGYRVRRSEIAPADNSEKIDWPRKWATDMAVYCSTCHNHKCKLGTRSTVIRAKMRNKSAYKTAARRRARHVTKYKLAINWHNDEFDHKLELGLDSWHLI